MTSEAAAALQAALAAEHAAVYVYAGLGGATSQASDAALYAELTRGYHAHRGQRDGLQAHLRRLGETPIASEAVYRLPADLSTAARVRAAALQVERDCAATYAGVVNATAEDLRADALRVLAATALRELRVGGEPSHFPGIAEFNDG